MSSPADLLLQRRRNYHAAQWRVAQKKKEVIINSSPSRSPSLPKKMPVDLLSVKTEVFEKLNEFNVQFQEFEDDLNTTSARLEYISILEKRFEEFEQHMKKQMSKTWDATLKAVKDHAANHEKFKADVDKEFDDMEKQIQAVDVNMDAFKDAVQAAFDEVTNGKVTIVTNEGSDSEATEDDVDDLDFLEDLDFADFCSRLRSFTWKRYTFAGKEYKGRRGEG